MIFALRLMFKSESNAYVPRNPHNVSGSIFEKPPKMMKFPVPPAAGCIPKTIAALSKLEMLWFATNQLTGEL